MEVRVLVIFSIAFLVYLSYRYEFQLKSWWRGLKCRKEGHSWVTVYGFTQQCRRCHKVGDIPKEVWSR